MKKILSLLLSLTLLATLFLFPAGAQETIQVTLNGDPIVFDQPPVMLEDRVLVPMRAIMGALGADVYWVEDLELIIAVKNDTKFIMQVGHKDFYQFTGGDFEQFQKQIIQGEGENLKRLQFDVPAQITGNRTLVPLRAIGEATGVSVSWDETNNTVLLTCAPEGLLHKNTEKEFGGRAGQFLLSIGFIIDDGYSPGARELAYRADHLDRLVSLNLIRSEDLENDAPLTQLEALQVLNKVVSYDDEPYDLSVWYRGNTLAPLDDLDDSVKGMLLGLLHSKNQILTTDELLQLDLNGILTHYEALVYLTRMIGNTYGCTDSPAELLFTEVSQTYNAAHEKGLIDQIDLETADRPIPRRDFYELLHKAIFVERAIGSYAPTSGRYIDSIFRKNKGAMQPKQETVVHSTEIPVTPALKSDFSVSWTLPQDYQFLVEEKFSFDIGVPMEDGTFWTYSFSTWPRDQINTEQLIQLITGAYPKKLNKIRCSYYQYSDNYQTKNEYYFDVDLSNVTMKIEGEELTPGVFVRYPRQWVPKTISLAGSQLFREGVYYLLTSYKHTYRNPEYNSVSRAVFRANSTSNTFSNAQENGLGVGGIYLEDIHIQEVTVKGSASTGFTLSVTPESKEIFKVEEAY